MDSSEFGSLVEPEELEVDHPPQNAEGVHISTASESVELGAFFVGHFSIQFNSCGKFDTVGMLSANHDCRYCVVSTYISPRHKYKQSIPVANLCMESAYIMEEPLARGLRDKR